MHRGKIIIILIVIAVFSPVVFAQMYTSSNYTLSNPRIAISASKADSSNYSLRRVIIGNIFGGQAQSSDYVLKIYCVINASIKVSPLDWILSEVLPGETKINSNSAKIILKNVGSVKVTYGIRVTDASGTWEASDVEDGNDLNKYSISAAITGTDLTDLGPDYFNESGNEDLVLEGPQVSTSSKFATTLSASNGVNVMPGEERALWLKFNAPKVDTSQEGQHNIWLIIEAKEVN